MNIQNTWAFFFLTCIGINCTSSFAKELSKDGIQKATNLIYEEILVTGGKSAVRSLSGSAAFLDEAAIKQFDITDLTSLLGRVPGVYIRFEDGYGLRPNIGIRGATSDRSQKLTLMEDGILIAPAPYAAPAAYYVPNVNRMDAVEVYKGPSSILYGPHTVGGALNLATSAISMVRTGKISVTGGTDNFQKYRVFYGDNSERFGYWVDALRYSSDGFKELDGGGDTGFERNDINAKLQWRFGTATGIYQELELKLGFADEDSDETYLGITDEDFANNPDRRYAASQDDKFDSEHQQIHIIHSADFNNGLVLTTKVYFNQFERGWLKFDGFLDPSNSLNRFDISPSQQALLTGTVSSDSSDAETLVLTNNNREYGSQGVETRAKFLFNGWGWSHNLMGGVRYHYDYVKRNHQVFSYLMQNGNLDSDGVDRDADADEKAESHALALFVRDEIERGRWTINTGLRYEHIDGKLNDHLPTNDDNKNSQSILIPGIGVFYQWTDQWGLLVGINKGFSPAGPAANNSVDPEESVNYEYGFRYTKNNFQADLIGFFSDYSNLLGRCRVSDAGCQVGDEFNGGDVEVGGAELTVDFVYLLKNDWTLPINLAYTYTESAFQNSFESGFSQWGVVTKGDELSYMPEHQLRLQLGIAADLWQINFVSKYAAKMRELPSKGVFNRAQSTRALTTFDISGSYSVAENLTITLVGENVSDKREIVSRRPLGGRPNAPRTIKLGVAYQF